MFATNLTCDLPLLLLIRRESKRWAKRERERESGQTYRERETKTKRSIHSEMQKERSSKDTNKVGGSFSENRGRVKRKRDSREGVEKIAFQNY